MSAAKLPLQTHLASLITALQDMIAPIANGFIFPLRPPIAILPCLVAE